MSVRMTANSYGKSSVRVSKITRHGDRHDIIELAIDIALTGDFTATYLTGDNRLVVATDTMKNTVYALAADHSLSSPESFALDVSAHFLSRYAHVAAADVRATGLFWRRIPTLQGLHRHAFVGGGVERRTCAVRRTRETVAVQAGLAGLPLLKTTASEFRDFLRDDLTTLPDTDDRIFATLLDAEWTYASTAGIDWNAEYLRIFDTFLAVFAEHHSLSVQQTLYAMGQAALEVSPTVQSMHLAMPNQHRIPFNLTPLGRTNRNEVFVTTSEPFGLITATLERETP